MNIGYICSFTTQIKIMKERSCRHVSWRTFTLFSNSWRNKEINFTDTFLDEAVFDPEIHKIFPDFWKFFLCSLLESVSYWSNCTRTREANCSCCFWILRIWMLVFEQTCYFWILLFYTSLFMKLALFFQIVCVYADQRSFYKSRHNRCKIYSGTSLIAERDHWSVKLIQK